MEYTQNYALRKPGLNEYANVGDLNYNSDKIDSQMKKNQDVDGEVYDPTSTSANAYEAGDYVINPDDGLMYVCNGTTYGTWDATKWDHTTEFEELQKAMASGGESELADLHDVEITNPTDGQALLYDPTSLKWHNSDLPDADVTKGASGNPIEFSDGADAPLVKCVTQITGSQDLHGQDKPWVGGAGKNIAQLEQGTIDITTGAEVSSTTRVRTNFMKVTPGETYCYSTDGWDIRQGIAYDANKQFLRCDVYPTTGNTITIPSDVSYLRYVFSHTDRTETCTPSDYWLQVEKGSTATSYEPYSNICPITAYTEGEIEVRGKNIFGTSVLSGYTITSLGVIESDPTRSATLEYTSIQGNIDYVLSYVGDMNNGVFFYDENKDFISFLAWGSKPRTFTSPSNAAYLRFSFNSATVPVNMMVEEGSTPTTYEPYTSTTHTTTLPSAIYRGSEDCVKGSVSGKKKMLTFNGSEEWTTRSVSVGTLYELPVDVEGLSGSEFAIESISNMYVNDTNLTNSGEFRLLKSSNTVAMLTIHDDSAGSLANFKTFLSTNNLQLVYTLTNETTEQVTPTNLPIKSLSGYNHIESSTGDMEIEYFPAKEQPLIDLIEDTVEQYANVYSTSERAIGEWIDGNTLYRRTYEIEVQSPSAPYTQDISISGMVVVGIEKHYANYQYSGTWYYESGDQLYTNSSQYLSITQKDEAGTALAVSSNMGNGLDAIKICFSILYTKTSNRSLAKSAPQEETKEEQVEEIKEEPEETKEEPVEEVKEEVKEEETKDPETNEEEKR